MCVDELKYHGKTSHRTRNCRRRCWCGNETSGAKRLK